MDKLQILLAMQQKQEILNAIETATQDIKTAEDAVIALREHRAQLFRDGLALDLSLARMGRAANCTRQYVRSVIQES